MMDMDPMDMDPILGLPKSAVNTKSHTVPLDNVPLETQCPLDNGRHIDASIHARNSVGQLDQLPAELLIQVMLQMDIPSLTRFRRVNRRAMEIVDSVPQYAALIRHCPNVIRAILGLEANAFDCGTLFRTLSTSRCSTCERFGGYIYLIGCRRACFLCFYHRPEYSPLTIKQAWPFFIHDAPQQGSIANIQTISHVANTPSVLGMRGLRLPGQSEGRVARERLRLFDRQAVVQIVADDSIPIMWDWTFNGEASLMSIITAPYLLDAGRRADWGYFCRGCSMERSKTKHKSFKYTREEILEHMARHGPVEYMPGVRGYPRHVPQV